jgi:hypothetical protein
MKQFLPLVYLCAVGLVSGCDMFEGPRIYSQAELTALTTRTVDANFDDTYHAALDALFDEGYTIEESDKAGGVITGLLRDDRSYERSWINPDLEDIEFRLSILIRARGERRTTVRLNSSVNGERKVDERAIDSFWTLMRRQVLLQAPAPPAPEVDRRDRGSVSSGTHSSQP